MRTRAAVLFALVASGCSKDATPTPTPTPYQAQPTCFGKLNEPDPTPTPTVSPDCFVCRFRWFAFIAVWGG